jgi:lipid II:glycine glycyltransferase (peptidoglycan interpeptide bridge formation enzyme)
MLFALRVRDASARVIATGLFLHDDRSLYFWGGASWQAVRHRCPNELLHWTAMSLAAGRGVARYDMSGSGQFKKKFGGQLVALKRWHKTYHRTARWGRRAYEIYFQNLIRLQGWCQRAVVGHEQREEMEA